jgi:protein-S-isoprenylcysteine O-methyltransferase Ste14
LDGGGSINQAFGLSRRQGTTAALLDTAGDSVSSPNYRSPAAVPAQRSHHSAHSSNGWAGGVLCIIGLAFTVWARATLGGNWSGAVTLKECHELIDRGPYRLMRHPIYTGLMTMFVATVIALGHLAGIIGALLFFVSFWIKLGDEEKLMLKHFRDQYAAYQQRVKRIISFVL